MDLSDESLWAVTPRNDFDRHTSHTRWRRSDDVEETKTFFSNLLSFSLFSSKNRRRERKRVREKMAKLLLLHAPQVVFTTSRSLVSATTAIYRRPLLVNSNFTSSPSDSHSSSSHIVPRLRSRRFSAPRAFDDSPASSSMELEKDQQQPRDGVEEDYPTGEMVYEDRNAWESFVVKFRMLFAYPWQRVRKGSVLTMTLRGQV